MPYTVTQLITNAYYSSGIVSREFETVQGYQLSAGLQFLNELIADKTVDQNSIPYYSKYEFNGVEGQEEYFIPNLIDIDTLVFFINSVRYSMMQTARDIYFGSSRADNINSLPYNYHFERKVGGASVFMYFKPDQNYLFQMWGQFRLSAVSNNQDLLSNVASFNLGTPITAGTNILTAGQLVINDIDLAGTYGATQPLVNLAAIINADVPNVTATVYLNSLSIKDLTGANIHIQTDGGGDPLTSLSFYNFSTLEEPLDQTYYPMILDQFYINYLRYQLAERLCAEFNFEVPQNIVRQLNTYEGMIKGKSGPMDLHVKNITMFDDANGINYGQVNLGKGWTV